jgi:hypothetical protein
MKNKKLIFFCISILILFSLSVSAETKKLRQVGRYKLMNVNETMPTEEVMKAIVERYSEDIKSGFDLAGNSDLYVPFIDQIKESAFEEKELAIGDKMRWMIFRSQGKVKIVQDLEWAGNAPLPVYSFAFVKGEKSYEFIMPKSCGNISLLGEEAVTTPVSVSEPSEVALEAEKVPAEQYRIHKPKIFEDIYDLLDEVDLYCSFSIWEYRTPDLRIIGAERGAERNMLSDGDVIYLNKGKNDGLETDQVFLIVEIGDRLPRYGRLAVKKGQVRLLEPSDTRSTAVIENSCGAARIGHYLVPLEPHEGFMGNDLGYDLPDFDASGLKGEVVYLYTDYKMIARGHWALIDLGAEDGIQVGQQLILYRRIRRGAPVQIFGNSVVIDVQSQTSTIKVLSGRDALRNGDQVVAHPLQ